MPTATVRANARALPKAIQPTLAAKSRTAGTRVPTCAVRPAPTPPASSASSAFDLVQAHADWRAACAKYVEAEKHYLEMCLNIPEPRMPEADEVRSKRLAKIYEQEDKLGEVIDRQCNVATQIVAAPASIETLSLKLEIFRYWWEKERNSDEPASVDPPLNGGDVMDVAAGIVLDILTMIRRGDGGLAEIGKAA
jgi:hypothetical protein